MNRGSNPCRTVNGRGQSGRGRTLRLVKRVASAVGEGAMSVQFVHEYLKAM